jgi:rhomboid protease GluP
MPISEPRLTYLLLAINVAIFMYYFPMPANQQYRFLLDWGKVNEAIRAGEYYRLLTAMFLHLDLTHILFNGLALYLYGRNVEALFGHLRFAMIYFLGGLSGSLASFVFTDALSVGASGALFAVFGAELVYFYAHRDLYGAVGRQYLSRLVFFMVIALGLGFVARTTATPTGLQSFNVDNAGHVGGLVGGVVLAWFIGPAHTVKPDPAAEGGLKVVDENPIERWALPSLLYAVGLVAVIAYAVSA